MLVLENIHYKIDDFELNSINLRVKNGEYVVILGESGSGKTVLLDIISGFRKPNKGKILKNETEITRCPIHKRGFAYVTSDNSLFPHLNVKNNIKLSNKLDEREYDLLVSDFGLSSLLKKYPNDLSSGEKQRVALARAIATKPDVLLLDEPLSSIDVNLRYEIMLLLRQLKKNGFTVIHVTHDVNEAIILSDLAVIMHNGRIVQKGNIFEILKKPANIFVAKLAGIKNVYKAQYYEKNIYKVENSINIMTNNYNQYNDCIIIISSSDVVLSRYPIQSSMQNGFKGKIIDIITSQNSIDIVININILIHATITQQSYEEMKLSVGNEIWVYFKASAIKVIPYFED